MQTQRKLIASSSSARLSTLPVKINFYVDVWTSVTLAERLINDMTFLLSIRVVNIRTLVPRTTQQLAPGSSDRSSWMPSIAMVR